MNKVFTFTLGAAVGSLLTWKLLEKKYMDLADDEIETFDEDVVERVEVYSEPVKPKYVIEKDKVIINDRNFDHNQFIQDLGYDINEEEDDVIITVDRDGAVFMEPARPDYIKPYIITPEEFGEIEHYRTCSWTYYSDLVITDDVGEIIPDPETYISDALTYFGEYEDDALHVRNENNECDYEIIKIEKSFSELNSNKTEESNS